MFKGRYTEFRKSYLLRQVWKNGALFSHRRKDQEDICRMFLSTWQTSLLEKQTFVLCRPRRLIQNNSLKLEGWQFWSDMRNRVILNMANRWRVSPLLESFKPKVSTQSGDFGSGGIPIIYHHINKLPQNTKAEQQFYFLHPLVGQELRRACLAGQFSLRVSHTVALIPIATIWSYVPIATLGRLY